MSELTVLLHPDPRLKKTCIPVTNIDKSIKKLCLDMIDTMYKYSGVGLAAPQVGILKRVVVMDCSEEGEKNPIILINPEIVWSSEENTKFEEGCLSIPEIREEIQRPSVVQVKFTDINVRAVNVPLRKPIIAHLGSFDKWPFICVDIYISSGLFLCIGVQSDVCIRGYVSMHTWIYVYLCQYLCLYVQLDVS